MHPGMMWWWKQQRHGGGCGPHAGGPGGEGPWGWQAHGGGGEDDFGGGAFGVRRPLRFLAYKLELKEEQVAELARILDELKTERAQASVDNRRTLAAFADALSGDAFDNAKVTAEAELRVKNAERLREAVVKALGRMHALLDAPQRAKLAYLIRTGALSL
jgi:Spy/CpxP family protein refolding chaperone